MFSFGGLCPPNPASLPPPTMGSATRPRCRLCPEISIIPTDNFWKFVAFAILEILRDFRIEK